MKVSELLYNATVETKYRIEEQNTYKVIDKGYIGEYFDSEKYKNNEIYNNEVWMFYLDIDNDELVVIVDDN